MKRVIVTGATSMIGAALVKECIKNNVEVAAVVRRQSANICRLPKSEKIEVIESDLQDLPSIRYDKACDVLFHMAWSHTGKETRDNPRLQEKNIRYALDAVDFGIRCGCSKFIGAGSQAEYGRVEGVICPGTPRSPETAYGMAKDAANQLTRKLCNQNHVTHIWGRIFSVYGRNDNPGTLLRYAIEQFLRNEKAVFSAATQTWNYLHENDAGKIFYLLGDRINRDKVYCIAHQESRILKSYIMELANVLGDKFKYEFSPENFQGQCQGICPDIDDLEKDINYTPQVSFGEGIQDMVKYMMDTWRNNETSL